MKNLLVSLWFLLGIFIPAIAQSDAEGSKDPALFTRMPGFYIGQYDDNQFDRYDFQISSEKTQAVEGHYLTITYYLKENTQAPSPLQVVRNYTNAIKKIGGQLVYEFEDGGYQNVILKLVKNGKETWAHVSSAENDIYTVYLVEKESMNQDVVADASNMEGSIKETGKVALYGIYFDVAKAIVKEESQPSLQEIAKLLNDNSSLKIYVVGHTDNTGSFDSNMKLSMDRAAAVVSALVTKYSVNAASLKACGAGAISPVASNETEEGRALNRRVELVKQ
jgi:outer membrane protein OmpA-like peptidoglycan-associated protein